MPETVFDLSVQILTVSGTHIIYDFSRETRFNFYALSNPWVTTSLVSSLLLVAIFSLLMNHRNEKMDAGSAATAMVCLLLHPNLNPTQKMWQA